MDQGTYLVETFGKQMLPRTFKSKWIDDIKQAADSRWFNIAQDREKYKDLGEAYVQRWTIIAE